MDEEELQELIGLALDDALPEALQARLAQELAKDPEAASDAESLRETVAKLKAARDERPDDWFVDRALSRLLRDHDAAGGVYEPHVGNDLSLTMEL